MVRLVYIITCWSKTSFFFKFRSGEEFMLIKNFMKNAWIQEFMHCGEEFMLMLRELMLREVIYYM
jgi:hypothetical protein